MTWSGLPVLTLYAWVALLWSCDHPVPIFGMLDEWLHEATPDRGNDTITSCPLAQPELQSRGLVNSPPGEVFNISDTVTFTCRNKSWTLTGPSFVICLHTGNWDRQLPRCKYVHCPRLIPPPHGHLDLEPAELSEPGTQATYTCDTGHVLDPQEPRTCLKNGSWSGAAPTCKAQCGELSVPVHGRVHYNCREELCPAQVVCEPGYMLQGDTTLVCGQDGYWAPNSTFFCANITCGPPPEVKFATLSGVRLSQQDFEQGTNVTYICDPGHVLAPQASAVLYCGQDGHWLPTPPQCPEIDREAEEKDVPLTTPASCGEPEPVANGTYHVFGKMARYTCDGGFQRRGDGERSCLENGTWSGAPPTCIVTDISPTGHPFMWRQVFVDNKQWKGNYLFNGKVFEFYLYVDKFNLQHKGQIFAHFFEDKGGARFEVKGFYSKNKIVFQMSKLLTPSPHFPNLNWYVKGQLDGHGHQWVYRGHVWATTVGFTSLTMRPFIPPTGHAHPASMQDHAVKANVTALGLGVTIAIIAILMAALLAAFCVRRKVGLTGSGHRTLATSFENPVYEYEQSLK